MLEPIFYFAVPSFELSLDCTPYLHTISLPMMLHSLALRRCTTQMHRRCKQWVVKRVLHLWCMVYIQSICIETYALFRKQRLSCIKGCKQCCAVEPKAQKKTGGCAPLHRRWTKWYGVQPKCQQSWPRCKEMVNGTRWSVFWLYDN